MALSLYSRYSLCSHFAHFLQKGYVKACTEKIFHRLVKLWTKFMRVTKNMLWQQKGLYDTQKRDSCWLNMFSVARKKNTCWQKIVPVIYKYTLYWLKRFCVTYKYFYAVEKLVHINVTVLAKMGRTIRTS